MPPYMLFNHMATGPLHLPILFWLVLETEIVTQAVRQPTESPYTTMSIDDINTSATTMIKYDVAPGDITQVYVLSQVYFQAFKQVLTLHR